MRMRKRKEKDLKLTEIFMAKGGIGMKGFNRCFHGTIKREKDENGKEIVVRGKILVKNEIHNGYIYAMAHNQWILGEKLDQLVILVLDKDLHSNVGETIEIAKTRFFLN